MPSTRPEKVNLTILLIAIKKQRGPGMIELLIFAQFSADKGFPDGSYKRTKWMDINFYIHFVSKAMA